MLFSFVHVFFESKSFADIQNKKSIAILDLQTERGFDKGLANLLNEIMLTKFQSSGEYEVLGASDINAMLNHEQQKKFLGCNEGSCFAEIGGALGVDYIASSNIGRIGSFFVLNIKIINIRKGKVAKRVSCQVKGSEDELIKAVYNSIEQLFNKKSAKESENQSKIDQNKANGFILEYNNKEENATSVENFSKTKILPWTLIGLGSVFGLMGATYGYCANSNYDKASKTKKYKEFNDLKEEGKKYMFIETVALTAAGFSLTSGAILFLLNSNSGKKENSKINADVSIEPFFFFSKNQGYLEISVHF